MKEAPSRGPYDRAARAVLALRVFHDFEIIISCWVMRRAIASVLVVIPAKAGIYPCLGPLIDALERAGCDAPSRIRGINEIRPMPTRNVSLTPEQDAFIEEVLEKGEYRNASEAICALQQRRAMDALKLERLRRSIDTGLADLERGDYEEVDDADLEAWLDRLVDARS